MRTPPEVSLYHRFENDLFGALLDRAARAGPGRRAAAHAPSSARSCRRPGGFVVPDHAIDAPSLVALADLVVSAGGTMNREAVALGTPVWTTFEGRLGAVDERLIAEGRLRRLERPQDVVLERRDRAAAAPSACAATRSCSWTCCAAR